MLGVIYGIAVVAGFAPTPGDASTYWMNTPGEYTLGGFSYPPVLSQLLEPLRWADARIVFMIGWMTLCFASLGYVLGRWAFLAVALVVPDIAIHESDQWWAGPIEAVLLGNVTMPMVAAMALGLRHPGWWAVPILTKITPGIGLLWFLFRGEWRQFALGCAVAGGTVAVSFALSPDAWVGYLRFLVEHHGAVANGPPIVGPPLLLRLSAAVLLVAWGARTKRPWTVYVAAGLALVGLYGWATFTSVTCGALGPTEPRDRGR